MTGVTKLLQKQRSCSIIVAQIDQLICLFLESVIPLKYVLRYSNKLNYNTVNCSLVLNEHYENITVKYYYKFPTNRHQMFKFVFISFGNF